MVAQSTRPASPVTSPSNSLVVAELAEIPPRQDRTRSDRHGVRGPIDLTDEKWAAIGLIYPPALQASHCWSLAPAATGPWLRFLKELGAHA